MNKITMLAAFVLFSYSLSAQVKLIPYGSVWKYLDNGSNQGTAWKNTSFNDTSWNSGPSELGYGDGDEATVVSFGPDESNKYITTYFRKVLFVPDASRYSSYTLRIKRDDGAIVYINGTEVYRTNLATGVISYTTLASSASDDGDNAVGITLPAGSLITGNNTIAVEIHQASKTSADISFDFQLTGIDVIPPVVSAITRMPGSPDPTNAANINYLVSFNEKVLGVDIADFQTVSVLGTISSTVTSVTPEDSSGMNYRITVGSVAGNGSLRVDLKSTGTAIKDEAGNLMTTGFNQGQSYTIDQTAPAVSSIVRQSPVLVNDNTNSVTYSVIFSESVTNVLTSSFNLTKTGTANATISGVAGSGRSYIVTIDQISGSGSLRLDLAITNTWIKDVAGNTIIAGFNSADTYIIDHTPPHVLAIDRLFPLDAITNATAVTYRVSFSENVTGIDPGDFTLITTGTTSAHIYNVVNINNAIYEVNVTGISGDGSILLSLKAGGTGITDNSGSAIDGGPANGQAYTIDQSAPKILSFVRLLPATESTNASSVTYRVSFSENVEQLNQDDLSIMVISGSLSGTVGNISQADASGSIYDITLNSLQGNGTFRLVINGTNNITDHTGNPFGSSYSNGETYTIDQTSPEVTAIVRQLPVEVNTNASTLTFHVVFSEEVTQVDENDFTVTVLNGNISSGSVQVNQQGTEGNLYNVVVSGIRGDATLRLDLKNNSGIKDRYGNLLNVAYTQGETYEIDQSKPAVIGIVRYSPVTETTNNSLVVFRAEFSEPVIGLNAEDFTITTISGATSGKVTDVKHADGEGKIYDITIASLQGNGIIRLDLLNNSAITDVTGNNLSANFNAGQTYTIDQGVPALISIMRQWPLSESTNSTSVTFRAVFSEKVNGVDASDFLLTVPDGNLSYGNPTISQVGYDGKVYDITVNQITGNGTLRIDLNANGGISDDVGNVITSNYNQGQTYTFDHASPWVTSIKRAQGVSLFSNASSVNFSVTFNEKITGLEASDFQVSVLTGTVTSTIASVVEDGTSGLSYIVSITGVSGNGSIRLDLKNNNTGITDIAGNNITGGYAAGEIYNSDQVLPEVTGVSRFSPSTFITNSPVLIYKVTFSENVSGVDTTDFVLFKSASATGSISLVTGSGSIYFVTVSSVTGAGTLRLDLKTGNTGITDIAGNNVSGSGYTLGKTFRLDRIPPVILSIKRQNPTVAVTTAGTLTWRVTFSEPVTGVNAADFTTSSSGNVNGSIISSGVLPVGADGVVYDVTITSVTGEGTIRLDVASTTTGIIDSVNNELSGSFTNGEAYSILLPLAPPGFTTMIPLSPVAVASNTSDKPQAKAWKYDNKWWIVLSTANGTKLFRLDNTTWVDVLTLAPSTNSKADCRVVDNITHVLLFRGANNGFLVSLEYDSVLHTYKFWSQRPSRVTMTFEAQAETASMIIDGNGRMWIGTDDSTNIVVRWSDAPYSNWSNPIVLATGIASDDICALNNLPGKIGLMWSNQNSRRFGFKTHIDGTDPESWSADEWPTATALDIGHGVADDHINMALSSNGTLYCAVKTSYDMPGYPQLSLLVRRPSGIWDSLYAITRNSGSRPIVLLNEVKNKVRIVYTSVENGGDILYKEASLNNLVFGDPITIWNGGNLDNFSTSTHQNSNPDVVILATNESLVPRQVLSVLAIDGTLPNSIPYVTAINRQVPAFDSTSASSVTFRVIFSEPVTGVDPADFSLSTSGTAAGNISSVSDINGSAFDVTVSGITGDGVIMLTLNPTGTNIKDVNDALVTGGFSNGQTYTIFHVVSTTPALLTRGPYIQSVNQTAITVRWRTDIATDSRIEAGTVYGTYNLTATSSQITTEHEIRINGLAPATKYFYRFGSTSAILQSGTDNYIVTAPVTNSTAKIRIAAFGDCGIAGTVQTKVLNAYLNYTGTTRADLLLILGDNAYDDGTDSEYQAKFFNPYGKTILKNHALFPIPGNHEYHTSDRMARNGPYYMNFTVPVSGECGGVPSGTESYYSFDWGNIHFINLDSYAYEADSTRLADTSGPQVKWLKNDLAANTKFWTIVTFHHPPFSMGTHNSDTEGELSKLRKNLIRILERYGVDLVLSGHSHDYERSYLLKGYYDIEPNFNPAIHTVTTSSGKYNGSANSCPYITTSGKFNHGTVYVVAGSAGRSGAPVDSSFPHTALPFATSDGGMLYFEVENNRLDAKLIHENGGVFDQFTILKNVSKKSEISVSGGSEVTLTASWPGSYQWSNGATTRSVNVSPAVNTTYIVSDANGCLKDTFNITVTSAVVSAKTGAVSIATPEISVEEKVFSAEVYPTPIKRGTAINIKTNKNESVEALVMDVNGRIIASKKFNGTTQVDTRKLAAGIYFIAIRRRGKNEVHQVIVTD